jgi:hypothetical protein
LVEEVDKGTVVCVKDKGLAALQVVPEGLDSVNHCQQLLFMDWVIALCWA